MAKKSAATLYREHQAAGRGQEGAAVAAAKRVPQKGLPASAAPFVPPPIPSGYYDPNLDASQQSANRGLLNLQQDTGLAGRYAQEDLATGTAALQRTFDRGSQDVNQQYQYGTQDANTTFDRGSQDIGTQRRYTGEDYTRNVGLLTRQYGQLARQQAEGARKYGVTSGGIALLSAARRAENQGIDQQGLTTDYTRANAGYDTSLGRLGEDKTTTLGRLTQGRDTSLSRLGEDQATGVQGLTTANDRTVAGLGTTLGRAQGENVFYGLDTNAQKLYQAQQAGYQAPTANPAASTAPASANAYAEYLKKRKAQGL